ncbi:P-loop containing nucleoside triphosphate hydrolase protein, partial [Blyttiomyces helicus]
MTPPAGGGGPSSTPSSASSAAIRCTASSPLHPLRLTARFSHVHPTFSRPTIHRPGTNSVNPDFFYPAHARGIIIDNGAGPSNPNSGSSHRNSFKKKAWTVRADQYSRVNASWDLPGKNEAGAGSSDAQFNPKTGRWIRYAESEVWSADPVDDNGDSSRDYVPGATQSVTNPDTLTRHPAMDIPVYSKQQSEEELKSLLDNIQHSEAVTPIDKRLKTPEELRISLLEHQKLGLEWMLKMEKGTNKGGILADDMGLGKTIQSIAVIFSNRSKNLQQKTTLIVAPAGLMPTKTKQSGGCCNQTSAYDEEDQGDTASSERDNESLRKLAGPLFNHKWHRVILDEAHTIKNRSTLNAKATSALQATHRWCLTGTPMQNNIGELFSLIKFLRIKPHCEWSEFRDTIETPLKQGLNETAIKRVQGSLR